MTFTNVNGTRIKIRKSHNVCNKGISGKLLIRVISKTPNTTNIGVLNKPRMLLPSISDLTLLTNVVFPTPRLPVIR